MAADAIGDAISGLGVDVPEGTTLLEMADIISVELLAKTMESSITLKTGIRGNIGTSAIGLEQQEISGSAFQLIGNEIKVLYDVTVSIRVSIPAGATNAKVTVQLQKNGANVKSSSHSSGSYPSSGTLSIIYSEKAVAGTKYSLFYASNGAETIIYNGTMTVNGTK